MGVNAVGAVELSQLCTLALEAPKPSAHSDPQGCAEAALAQQIWTLMAPIQSNLTSEHLCLGDLKCCLNESFPGKKVVQVLLSNKKRFRFGTRVSLVSLKCHLLPWTALKLLLLCTEVIPSLRLRCLLEVQC